MEKNYTGMVMKYYPSTHDFGNGDVKQVGVNEIFLFTENEFIMITNAKRFTRELDHKDYTNDGVFECIIKGLEEGYVFVFGKKEKYGEV